ncbi:hypothetical protein [Nocardioides sp. CER19]|uniref:hypothetical protein n=1 Tax=Nocardioides sp. CER19 TaxID=3038538 RepID=UPI0024474127|nr:hypothetical protein [Nocardioides sp. CER19]MDH2413077.1 hypothetical protein [Nocardioides sp. CER19]
MPAPLGDIAHLGHVELLTADLDGSAWFFTEILGVTETRRLTTEPDDHLDDGRIAAKWLSFGNKSYDGETR